MRWIEHRIIKVAIQWNIEEVTAAKPSRKQLSDTCLNELTRGIWLEIGGSKQPLRYTKTQPKPGQ